MDRQLEALTRKLYDEGIQKAESEAVKILDRARQEADQLLGHARQTAEDLRQSASQDADQFVQRAHAELHLAARQTMGSIRTALEGLIRKDVLEHPVKSVLHEPKTLTDIIRMAIEKMNIPQDGEPRILLSAEDAANVSQSLKESLLALFQKEPLIQPLPGIQAGFRIQNGMDGYQLSFTDDDFIAFLMPYLSKEVQQILRTDDE